MEESIEKLNIEENILEILKNNKITKIVQLTQITRKKLKELGLYPNQITEIAIKLQLKGYNLKCNY